MEVVNTVGRRKAAVARVYVKPGKGQITINRKELAAYFPLEILQFQVKQPLLATNTAENFDITINLDGGGIKGQAEAARLGIARTTGNFGKHGVGSKSEGLPIYIICITARLPRRGKLIGTSQAATRRVEEKRIKINQRNELKCHVQILIHYWKPVRTSVI